MPLGRVRYSRETMMIRARAKPATDSQANVGFTWPLLPVVWRGRVTGATGRWPPIPRMVVVGAWVAGVVGGTVVGAWFW